MLKIQIGLGVLSLPHVFDTIGMIPGVILLLVVGVIATYTSYMVGVFKKNHPEVYSIDDAGAIIAGRIGREFFAIAILLCELYSSTSSTVNNSLLTSERDDLCRGIWYAGCVDWSQRGLGACNLHCCFRLRRLLRR